MKLLLVPLGLLLLIAWTLRMLFGRDEAPTELARAWAERPAAQVPDAENAWYWMLGLGAAADEDPVRLAQRRLAAYEARVQLGPAFWRDAELKQLAVDPTPFVETPGNASPFVKGGCPAREVDCVEWAARYDGSLDLLESANALRLQRYAQARALQRYEDRGSASITADLPMFHIATPRLHLDLVARDAARGEAPEKTLARLAEVASFWRRNAEQSRGLLAKRVGDAMLERCWRLGRELLQRHPALLDSPAAADALQALWQPPSASYRDQSGELRWLHQAMVQGAEETIGIGGVPADCLQLRPGGCVENVLVGAAYAPQGTRNLSAATYALIEKAFLADARDYRRVLEESRAPFNALHPVFDGDFVSLFRQGNPTGRVLVAIAVPAYAELIERRHDVEGLRRLFELLQLAQAQGIEPQAMQAFLDRQPAARRDPYTGQAFGWNPLMRELWFAPRSAHWQRPQLIVPWPASDRPGAAACRTPLRILLRSAEGPELEAHACGMRDEASVVGPTSEREADWEATQRVEYLTAAGLRKSAAVRLAWRDPDDRLLGYEALDLTVDGEYAPMRPLGHDGEVAWQASAAGYTAGPMVRVLFKDAPAIQVAREAVAIAGVHVAGLGGLCSTKVTFNFGAIPLRDVLVLLGDECGLELQGDAVGEWRFVPYPAQAP